MDSAKAEIATCKHMLFIVYDEGVEYCSPQASAVISLAVDMDEFPNIVDLPDAVKFTRYAGALGIGFVLVDEC